MVNWIFQVAQICAVKAFGDVQHFRVRMTDVVKPRLIVEPHRVHHRIISLPVANDLVPIQFGIRIPRGARHRRERLADGWECASSKIITRRAGV